MGPESGVCLALANADADELAASSSGGAFSVLAHWAIDRGGIVYGHAFDEGLHVGCTRIDSLKGLDTLRGSKYVQSDMGEAMGSVLDDLKTGVPVLFSGTPCQVAGLKAFLSLKKADISNLLLVDIVCHGVPSQLFFSDCARFEFAGNKVDEIRFRDSREGWGCAGRATVAPLAPSFRGSCVRSVPYSPQNSYYYRRFLTGDVYRESCYRCPYAGGLRPGDVTIGDFWGIDFSEVDLDSKKGISLLIANTPKGKSLVPWVKEHTLWAERPITEAVAGNDQLRHPTPRPENRNALLERWKSEGIAILEAEYKKATSFERRVWRVKRAIKKMVKGALRG